jgi:arabinan endo-1,5-alpha-L-arabinosidase
VSFPRFPRLGAKRCRVLACLLCCIGAMVGSTLPATAASPARPYLALDQDFPDPAVLQFHGENYAYSTNAGGLNVPVATASRLYGQWSVSVRDALPAVGSWANTGLTWAPDVSRLPDGRFLMYYTAQDRASGRQCIGAAIAAHPAGPFGPVGDAPLVCPTDIGGAIDPAAFIDSGGRRYLVYKNDGNAIGLPTYLYVQRVARDGVTLQGAPTATIRNGTTEGNLIEAPFLVHRGRTYYMFYSYGAWNNDTYTEGYATAPSLSGPWTKSGTPLLSTTIFGGSVVGPGGMSVLRGSGDSRIVFHGVRSDPTFHRGLYVDDLSWRHGVPVAAGSS